MQAGVRGRFPRDMQSAAASLVMEAAGPWSKRGGTGWLNGKEEFVLMGTAFSLLPALLVALT